MRVNFEMNDSQMNSLRDLQGRTGAPSIKDLVNNALSILEWAADETARGNEIAAVNEEQSTYRVLVTPLLQHVARHRSQVPVGA